MTNPIPIIKPFYCCNIYLLLRKPLKIIPNNTTKKLKNTQKFRNNAEETWDEQK